MLVNSRELLIKASKDGYAIGAYNINNLEFARYILEACNEDKAPVIIAVSEPAINYMGGYEVVSSIVRSLINDLNIKVPVVLHLDHAKSFESCKKAIDKGFTSVMIDASDKTLEENILITNKVKEYADPRGVTVEAELGSLTGLYTDVNDCMTFINETKVDSLAPPIGNKHGIYKEEANLDFELLGKICKEAKLPLVLHGASGLDDNKIKTAIFCGVSKININTDIQLVWSKKVREFINENKSVYDPRLIIASGKQAVKDLIHEKNELLESKRKAF